MQVSVYGGTSSNIIVQKEKYNRRNVPYEKNNCAQTPCRFRPKTSRWRRRLEVANHRSLGFGSVYRNTTTDRQS